MTQLSLIVDLDRVLNGQSPAEQGISLAQGQILDLLIRFQTFGADYSGLTAAPRIDLIDEYNQIVLTINWSAGATGWTSESLAAGRLGYRIDGNALALVSRPGGLVLPLTWRIYGPLGGSAPVVMFRGLSPYRRAVAPSSPPHFPRPTTLASLGITDSLLTTGSIAGGGTLSSGLTLSLVNDILTPAASQYYGTDLTGVKGWFNLPSGGGPGGGVTSVAMTVPAYMTVSGSPITTSGTFALGWGAQAANQVFASPSSGTGAPAFRALAVTDIPGLPWSKLTSGVPTTLSGYGIVDGVSVTRLISTSGSLTGGGALNANLTLSLIGDQSSPGNSKYYGTDSSGTRGWYVVGFGGTVTSVAVTVPDVLTIGGSPITTSGTLSFGLTNQSANTVFAGPTTGAASTPAFRALDARDLGTAVADRILQATSSSTMDWVPVSGDAALTSGGVLTLVNTIAGAGPIGSTSSVPVITFDSKGRLTTVTSATITPASIGAVEAGPATASGLTISSSRLLGRTSGATGAIEEITVGAGLLFASQSISLPTTVTAGGPTGSSSIIPVITYDAYGRLTAVTTATVTPSSIGAAPSARLISTQHSLTGGGDLSADRTLSLVNDTAAPGASKYYGTDSGGVRGWFSNAGGGTVSSVAISAPSFLSVSGSPITTTGTLALSLANQTANVVFAGPTNGSAAAPTFRAMDARDLGVAAANQVLQATSTSAMGWVTVGGDATFSAGTLTLASVISAGGPTGSSSVVPVITYDAKGRLTAVTSATITPAAIGAVPTSRLVSTQHSLAGGGDLSADRTIALVNDTAAPGATKYYGTDGSGVRGWFTLGAGGTVSSVAISAPSFLSVSGSPITTTGTLALSLANQAANAVFAGPTNGAATAPTFRVLDPRDLGVAATNQVLQATSASTMAWMTLGGDATLSGGTLTLASVIAGGGPTGSSSVVPVITYDAKGRLTAVTTATITPGAIGAATSGAVTASGLTMSTARLLGRSTASTGAVEEITVGAGLTLVGGTLTASISSTAGGVLTGTYPNPTFAVNAEASQLAVTATGTATARQLANRFVDVINIKDFGATGDGSTVDSVFIQNAINAAETLATTLGGPVLVFAPQGQYVIATGVSVALKSNVYLDGYGTFVRQNAATATGALKSLFTGQNISNFGIKDVTFKGVGPDRKIAGSCTDATTFGNMDSAIDLDTCTDFYITQTNVLRTMDGIKLRGCGRGIIQANRINSQSSKTLAQLDAGTFTPYVFSSASRGGAIQCVGFVGATDVPPCYDVAIVDNDIECVGLDQGIDLGSQGNETFRVHAVNNKIRGTSCGVQTYSGAIVDDGGATTAMRGTKIIGNIIRLTYEQGIYIRSVAGVYCFGNWIERCCIAGIGPAGGTSGGAIVNRGQIYTELTVSPIAFDVGNVISGNFIIDCGNPTTGTCDNGIRCDASHSVVENNYLHRSFNRFGANLLPAANCSGIHMVPIGSQVQPDNTQFRNNHIYGYSIGVFIEYAAPMKAQQAGALVYEGNTVDTCATGFYCVMYGSGLRLKGNTVRNASTYGFLVQNSPGTEMIGNKVVSVPVGYRLMNGNLWSDLYGQTTRHGASITFLSNEANNCATPLEIPNVSGTDNSIFNRCSAFNEFLVDGRLWIGTSGFTTTAAPTTSANTRSWEIGAAVTCRTPVAAGTNGWYCASAGTFGANPVVTATTTAASTSVVLSANDEIVPGDYITIAGVTGTKRVMSYVSTPTPTATVDVACDNAVAGAAISRVAPTFVGSGNVSGTGLANSLTVWSGTNALTNLTALTATNASVAYTQTAQASGTAAMFTLSGGAHTNLTASAEVFDVNINLGRTVQRATGAVTTQRAMVIQAPTYGFVGASVITSAATLAITNAPQAGTNATITNAYALWVQAGQSAFAGKVLLAASTTTNAPINMGQGTAPTSPVNGDIWTTTAGLYVRVNGSTVGPLGAGGGGGSVTSVALTAPSELSVAGSPITTSGTLSLTWAAAAQNAVFIGPVSGGAGVPAFRVLAAADLPSLSGLYLALTGGTMGVGSTFITAASATGQSGLRIPHGADPSAPTDGDVWTTTAGLYVRVNGSTVGPLGAGGGGGISGSGTNGAVTIWTGSGSVGTLTSFTASNATIAFTQAVQTSGSANALTVVGGAHTTLTASTEATDVLFSLNRTVQFATGALTTQRAFVVAAPTYSFVAASVVTTAATFAITDAPTAGTNATLTNRYALWVQAGTSAFAGLVLTAASTTATAGFRLPHGTAPTSPVNGDFWTTTTQIQVRLNGSTTNLVNGGGTAGVITYNSSSSTIAAATGFVYATTALTWTQAAASSGVPVAFSVVGGSHTAQTAGTEAVDVNINLARTVQHATGAITTQRSMRVQAPTHSFVAASVITTAATLSISNAPQAGTNATITNAYALWVEAGTVRIEGTFIAAGNFAQPGTTYVVATTGGSSTIGATSPGIVLDSVALIATYTVTMPATPVDGQLATIAAGTSGGVTSLTVSPNSGQSVNGAPTSLAANGFATWKYRTSNTTWYRVG